MTPLQPPTETTGTISQDRNRTRQMSDPATCERHAPLIRYEDACLTATCTGCCLGEAERMRATVANKVSVAIATYRQSPTEATREALSDAMFEMEATLLWPDDDPVYIEALLILF